MSEKVLSFVLNEGVGKSYRDYINGLRVDAAKAMLVDPAHRDRSVLVVGMDSGFSSKATFNRIFKQFTDITPTDYRKRRGI
jgi:AraC-like DNA-binding protein